MTRWTTALVVGVWVSITLLYLALIPAWGQQLECSGCVPDAALVTPPFHTTKEAGTSEDTATTGYDFDGGDFNVDCTSHVCAVSAGPTLLVDGGGGVGGSTDWESQVNFSSTEVLLPNSTTPPGSCTTGQIYLDTDATTPSVTGLSVCKDNTTRTYVGDILSGGLAGGQTINGGTAAGNDLALSPTSNATQTSSEIQLCSTAPTYGTGTPRCLSLLPNGLTWGGASGNYLSGLYLGGTLTQTATALNTFSLINADYTWKINPDAIAFGTNNYLFRANLTVSNENNTTTVGGPVRGLDMNASCNIAGDGTAFTIASVDTVAGYVGTIGTSCTVTDYYAGGHAVSGGTVNGTLTRWRGFHADAPTVGSDRYQFSAGEHTITASAVPAGDGAWGVESGSPNRFYFVNESEQVWRMGYLTLTATGTGTATTAVTRYFSGTGISAVNATEGSITAVPLPGAAKVYGMTCGLAVAAGGGTDAHAITLRNSADGAAAADTAVTCTITTTAKECQYRSTSGVTVAAGSAVTFKDVTTDTPAANTVTCVIFYNVDVW